MKSMNWIVMVLVALFAWGCCGNCQAADAPLKDQVVSAVSQATADLVANNQSNIEQAVAAATAHTKEIIGQATSKTGPVVQLISSAAATGAAAANNIAQKHGWGAEAGTMIRELIGSVVDGTDGLLTVSEDHIYKFADTDLGKYTIFAVGWKLFAQDFAAIGGRVMDYAIGIGILIGLTKLLWGVNRRMTVGQMIVVRKKGWGIFTSKEWEFKEASVKDDETKGYIHLGTGIAQVVLIIIVGMIIW